MRGDDGAKRAPDQAVRRGRAIAALGLLLAGCGNGIPRSAEPGGGGVARADGSAAVEPAPRGAETPVGQAAPVAPAPPVASEAAAGEPAIEACGPYECRRFDAGSDALAFVLDGQPVALGVGEAHALAGSEHVASTARRFADELLPSLGGRASHLVVELLNPDPRCETATREVREKQEPVTAPQSAQNQSDYVELGRRARALGIEPFVLSPSCDEFRAIAGAGDRAIEVMLETIARVTSRMLRGALAKNRAAGRAGVVIGYGGALHNDIEPSAAKASWSYGPDLVAFTQGGYVELDLIVREFVKDTDTWRALPWYPYFDPARFADRWLVMRTGPQRYALFFPRGAPAAPRPSATPSSERSTTP